MATGELVLFLNPDVRLYQSTLARTVEFMAQPSSADIGICGVRLEDQRGDYSTSAARFPSVWSIVRFALGLRSTEAAGLPSGVGQSDAVVEVDQVIGAYFLVRSELFRQRGFDEALLFTLKRSIFLGARLAGRRSVCLADVGAFHFGGGSSQQVKALRLFYSLRSRLQYAYKHFSAAGFVCVLSATIFVEIFSRSVLALARGSKEQLAETCVAYRMLLCWIPQWWLKDTSR
ncbi:glycosyltransferase family 2 protein [Candidatus Aalborgicola defluviihabitans]|uniref:glycosyltransferase family 2 protein n=1 Tax=Candidatus Aalborgicola defluviihabitans TaxID=3386187 RepID=UPI001E09AD76|nr:glycosyltransferase family 2 protein [Burkholderiales bacterium]